MLPKLMIGEIVVKSSKQNEAEKLSLTTQLIRIFEEGYLFWYQFHTLSQRLMATFSTFITLPYTFF